MSLKLEIRKLITLNYSVKAFKTEQKRVKIVNFD
jgi:hypothetical protein